MILIVILFACFAAARITIALGPDNTHADPVARGDRAMAGYAGLPVG